MSKYPHHVFQHKNAGRRSLVTFNHLSRCLKAKCSTLEMKCKEGQGHWDFMCSWDTCSQKRLEVRPHGRFPTKGREILHAASARWTLLFNSHAHMQEGERCHCAVGGRQQRGSRLHYSFMTQRSQAAWHKHSPAPAGWGQSSFLATEPLVCCPKIFH